MTTTQLDAMGRTATVSDGGGGTLGMTYAQNDVLSVVGPAPTGEHTKQKQLEYDAYGRITSVCEETSTLPGRGTCAQISSQPTGYFTKYAYDSPANSVTVTQNIQPGAIGGTQTRTYLYDGVGRLISETNPETGATATTYTYDTDGTCGTSNGDLVKKVDPALNVTCFAYDGLHRNIGITYPSGPNAGVTPSKTFIYDATTFTCTNPSNAFVKGRLAEAFTGLSTAKLSDIAYCYSARGEIADAFESTANSGGAFHTTATYYANGALNTLNGIPAQGHFTFALDGEGRPLTANAGATATNSCTGSNSLLKCTSYNAGGQLTGLTLCSGDTDSWTPDPNTGRMSGYQFNVGPTGSVQSLIGAVNWNPNGTLGSQQITQDPSNTANVQTCAYVHDDLARIQSVNCTNGATNVWNQNFTLDPFGNVSKSGTSSFLANYILTNGTTNNREQPMSGCTPTYDLNGNLITDCSFATPAPYSWDADGNAISLNGVGVAYDAFDRMIEQNNSGVYTQVLYGPIGKIGVMKSLTTYQRINIPLPGGDAAVYDTTGPGFHYRHADWLGSARFASSSSQTKTYDRAFAPYGEVYANSGNTGKDIDFTGQLQDTTAGLQDFLYREYNPVQGRWIQPDPAGLGVVDFSNPQTWNRYAYVQNGPLNSIDPDGRDNFIPWLSQLSMLGVAVMNAWGQCSVFNPGGASFDAWGTSCDGGGANSSSFSVQLSVTGGDGIWPEWDTPFPTNLDQVLQTVWSEAIGLPTLPCSTSLGPWCNGQGLVNPIMDAQATIFNCPDATGYDRCAAKWIAANQITHPCTIGGWYLASAGSAVAVSDTAAAGEISEAAQAARASEAAATLGRAKYWLTAAGVLATVEGYTQQGWNWAKGKVLGGCNSIH